MGRGGGTERTGTSVHRPDCVFSRRARRNALRYVLAAVPIVAVTSVLADDLIAAGGQRRYLVAWVLVAALFTTPALVAAWLAASRAPESDRPFWRTWFAGMVLVYLIGATLIAEATFGGWWTRAMLAATVGTAIVVFGTDLMRMMRSRSGGRDVSIDAVEFLIGVVVVAGPVVLWVARDVAESAESWYALPAMITAVILVGTVLWSVMLYTRLDSGLRRVEGLGVALAVASLANAVAQVAQGVSGFTLPVAPLLVLQATCMALALLTPFNLPRDMSTGLDRLPPQAQVRNGRLVSVAVLAVVPVLAIESAVRAPTRPWVLVGAACVLAVLVVLAMVRHLLTMAETRRLYSKVERAAEDRRALLTEVLARADADRHRVAAQLHEQAVGAYASFVAATGGRDDAEGSKPIRDDLARQAESLRRLMMAIQPIEPTSTDPGSLRVPISAHVDGLYGNRPSPALIIDVDEDLHLDWTTETVALRILQEALANVARHAQASCIRIALAATDEGVVVVVADDGIGFDPSTTMFESGIATMRSFAAFTGGDVAIESAPGAGTTVTVVLRDGGASPGGGAPGDGQVVPARVEADRSSAPAPHLRLVGGGADADRSPAGSADR